MPDIIITNNSNGCLLADKGKLADNYFTRLKGLLNKKSMPAGSALIIKPCSMVHSIGMKMYIDVLFVSSTKEVVHIIEAMKPNRVSPFIHNAQLVIELPAGQIQKTATLIGHTVSIT